MSRIAGCLLIPVFGHALAAQAPRFPADMAGATFIERVHSDVIAASGTAERHRVIDRQSRYAMTLRGDTLVVSADSIRLDETADNARRSVDVDAVIGGRWKLLAGAENTVRVVDAPFVPGDVADVSDLGSAMDDFFPPAPPSIAQGARLADAVHGDWRRLPDSAHLARYRWTAGHRADSTSIGADSVPVRAETEVHEDGAMVQSPRLGPVAWTRRIVTAVTSHFAGRTVRATVDQRIDVMRMTPR